MNIVFKFHSYSARISITILFILFSQNLGWNENIIKEAVSSVTVIVPQMSGCGDIKSWDVLHVYFLIYDGLFKGW